jgi:hypothetical protein
MKAKMTDVTTRIQCKLGNDLVQFLLVSLFEGKIMSSPSLEADMAAVSMASKDGTDEAPKLNALGHPLLQPMTPVPSDITISQHIVRTVGLLPIQEVAKQ